MGGSRAQHRRAKLKRQLSSKVEDAQKISEEPSVPQNTGYLDLSSPDVPLPVLHDEERVLADRQDNPRLGQGISAPTSPVDVSVGSPEANNACLNFNKGRCTLGRRCRRLHIRIPEHQLREIEARMKCRFSSKDECKYKDCPRVHSAEKDCVNPPESESPSNCDDTVEDRGYDEDICHDVNDEIPGGELIASIEICSTGPDEVVVKLPTPRKPPKAKGRRRKGKSKDAASPSESLKISDEDGLVYKSASSEGFQQSCLPLSLSDTDSEQTIPVVQLRSMTSDDSSILSDNTAEDARIDAVLRECMFCILGLCNGQRCQKSSTPVHEDQPEMAIPKEKEEQQECDQTSKQPSGEFTTTLYSRMKVTIGPGMQISKIVTADESTSIIIANLPSFVQESDIRNICARYGTTISVRIFGGDRTNSKAQSDMLSAKVVFETIEQAKKAVKKLNGSKRFYSILHVNTCLPGWGGDPAVGMLSNSIVRIDFPAPGRTVFLGRSRLLDAQGEVTTLHGVSIRGNTISATHYEGLPRIGECTVKVEGLPANIRDEDIRSLCTSDGPILLGHVINISLQDAVSAIHQYLDECGEIIKCDLPVSAVPKDGRLFGMIHFSTPEAASTACSTLNGRRIPGFYGEKIFAAHLHSVSYIVPSYIYAAILPEIRSLQDLAHCHNLQLLVLPNSDRDGGRVRMKLMAEGGMSILGKVKYPLERLLSGQRVQMESGPVWDVFFGMRIGVEYISQVGRFTGTFIRADEYKGQITVWGTANARARASRQITNKVIQLQSTRTFIIPFEPGMISKLLSTDLLAIQDNLGEHNVELDLSARCLRIRGNHTEYLSVKALLQGRGRFRIDRPLVLSNETCPVCLSSVIEPVSLKCVHKTCRSCLSRYISSSVTHRSFPLKCLGDDAACPEPVPVSICRRLLPADEFVKVAEASFQAYTTARPHEFRRCPSANCAQVYKLENESKSKSQSLQCPSCLIRVCPYCHEEEHQGYQCASMEKEDEQLYSQWKEAHDVHPCPNCHADIEKAAGCNHVTCSQCGTHICWVCLTTFTDSSDVYRHMRDVHGGIG